MQSIVGNKLCSCHSVSCFSSDICVKELYLVDGKGCDDVRFLVDDACLSSGAAKIWLSLHRQPHTHTNTDHTHAPPHLRFDHYRWNICKYFLQTNNSYNFISNISLCATEPMTWQDSWKRVDKLSVKLFSLDDNSVRLQPIRPTLCFLHYIIHVLYLYVFVLPLGVRRWHVRCIRPHC